MGRILGSAPSCHQASGPPLKHQPNTSWANARYRGSHNDRDGCFSVEVHLCAMADDAGFPCPLAHFFTVLVLPNTVQVIPHVAARARAYR